MSGALPSSPGCMKTIILAAGEGSRLRGEGETLPKPLARLGGLSLLERVVRNAAKAGAAEFVIVVGCRGDEIIEALEPRLKGFAVRWVRNPEWRLGNGTSVLAARPFVGDEPFLVLMADHLVFPATLERLVAAGIDASGCVMAVDRKRGVLVDPDDAMKVRLDGDRIVDVGKALESWGAIDVGAAVCRPAFFDALEAAAARAGGRCAHSDGMRALAGQGLLGGHDIGADRWEDVDTEPARRAASDLLFDSLRKPTDGFLSRSIERRLSLAVTRRLAETPVTPNQVSLGVVAIGAVAALLFAQPSDVSRVLGALVFWCASFLDGCDGELARLRFQESRLGGWLDLWVDNVVHCLVFFGMAVGLHREPGRDVWLQVGAVAVIGVLLSVGWASWQTWRARRAESGPLFVSVFGSGDSGERSGALGRLRWLADVLSRRDFIFAVILFALLDWIPYFLWAAALGANLYFLVLVLIEVWQRREAV